MRLPHWVLFISVLLGPSTESHSVPCTQQMSIIICWMNEYPCLWSLPSQKHSMAALFLLVYVEPQQPGIQAVHEMTPISLYRPVPYPLMLSISHCRQAGHLGGGSWLKGGQLWQTGRTCLHGNTFRMRELKNQTDRSDSPRMPWPGAGNEQHFLKTDPKTRCRGGWGYSAWDRYPIQPKGMHWLHS